MNPPTATAPIDLLDAPIGAIMRAQTPVRRLRPDRIDDDTLLTLLELASHATAGQPTALRVRRRARPRRPPPARPRLPAGLVDLPAGAAHPRPGRRAPRGPAMGGRPLRGRSGDRRRLRSRPPTGVLRDRRRAPSTRAPCPRCRTSCSPRVRDRPGRRGQHPAAVVGLGGPPHPRPPPLGHAGRGHPARPAARPAPPRRPFPRSGTSCTSTATGISRFGAAFGANRA